MTNNMTIEQIQSLLARFYEGQTTPDEERQLAAYFRREDVPEELQDDKQLFLMLAQISDQEIPADIAEEITAFVNNLGQTETRPLPEDAKQRKGIIFRFKTPPKIAYRAAAAVALLIALGGGILTYQRQTDPFRDTCTTQEEAAQALQYANDILNKSRQAAHQSINTAAEQINESKTIIHKYIQL